MISARTVRLGTLVCAFACSALAASSPAPASSALEPFQIEGSQITGPDQQNRGGADWFEQMNNWKREPGAAHDAWLRALKAWRRDTLERIKYDGSRYDLSELKWSQRDFVQPQVMAEDRYLYDPSTGQYTVTRLLDDLNRRYGGVDSVLLWPVYPNIGVDDRNQWDLARDLPGGIAGVRAMIAEFHRHGVRVLFPTMPWDTGTRDPGVSQAKATAQLMAEFGADGINGDTCPGLPLEYATAAQAAGHPLVLEPELSPAHDAMLAYNLQSWAYWAYPFVPMVSKWKWLEPRHMINVCDRWATDRTDVLQAAFFNGVGVESWENVWGYWNGFTDRDAEALRRISTIYRAFPTLFVSRDWSPFVPTLQYGVYASLFPEGPARLWTVVNRNPYSVGESVLPADDPAGHAYYDLWNGRRLTPRRSGTHWALDLPLEARGYGCVLELPRGAEPSSLPGLLARIHQRATRPLASYSAEWHFLPQHLVPIPATRPAPAAPPGMVLISGGRFDFRVRGIEIEGENKIGIDVQYPWETSPRREHDHELAIRPFYIDRFPVTNAQFKAFLDATHYAPADAHNFLRDWLNGSPRPGWENRPVTWVSLEDARAYAAWAGKRLPHEWEWQFAAQGGDGRRYPWGDRANAADIPPPQTGRTLGAPAVVGTHPAGASPFGVEDLVGTVWQWTDEHMDEHTRFAIVRGGSDYHPGNSFWYFPNTTRLDEHGKYLLMAPAKDRSARIGFRCVVDATGDQPRRPVGKD